MRWFVLVALVATAVHAESKAKESPMSLKVKSPAFEQNAPIPKKHAYTGEGENLSPAISWEGAPAATKSLVLICDDPDAPRAEPWVHWVVYGIPPAAGLAEAKAGSAIEGVTDFKSIGWGGPMPPKGHGTHHYRFRVYAVDLETSFPTGRTKAQILSAIKGHVLAEGELVGTYERK